MTDTQVIDVVTFDFKGTRVHCFVSGSTEYQMNFSLVQIVSKQSKFVRCKISLICVLTFRTGRHTRRADTTLLFEYISQPTRLWYLSQVRNGFSLI